MDICAETVWLDEAPLALVAQFHQAFNHPISNRAATFDDLDSDLGELRLKLINEEHRELNDAWAAHDMQGVIDALQDLKYVIYGAELALGIASEEHFREVHAANMRKLGPDGKPIYREDGKVMKPEGWTGPDHSHILDRVHDRGSIYP